MTVLFSKAHVLQFYCNLNKLWIELEQLACVQPRHNLQQVLYARFLQSVELLWALLLHSCCLQLACNLQCALEI